MQVLPCPPVGDAKHLLMEIVMNRISRFLRDQAGAVTVDWIVLTAAVVALASSVGVVLNGGGEDSIASKLREIIVNAVDGVGAESDD